VGPNPSGERFEYSPLPLNKLKYSKKLKKKNFAVLRGGGGFLLKKNMFFLPAARMFSPNKTL